MQLYCTVSHEYCDVCVLVTDDMLLCTQWQTCVHTCDNTIQHWAHSDNIVTRVCLALQYSGIKCYICRWRSGNQDDKLILEFWLVISSSSFVYLAVGHIFYLTILCMFRLHMRRTWPSSAFLWWLLNHASILASKGVHATNCGNPFLVSGKVPVETYNLDIFVVSRW